MPIQPHQQIYEDATRVRRTLANQGLEPGSHQLRAGPVVAVRRVYFPDSYGQDRIYVDHAGPGRREALDRYREVLENAGFEVATGTVSVKVSARNPKQFLWVRGKSKNAAESKAAAAGYETAVVRTMLRNMEVSG